MPIKRSDLTGFVSGRLKALRPTNCRAGDGTVLWDCICDCGKSCLVSSSPLKSKTTKSCGCLRLDAVREASTTHGMRSSPEYNTWAGLLARCRDSGDSRYGGRGISVCERWKNSFENFYEDMGQRPTKKHSIDRKDNSGPYSPDNCGWATSKEQAMNRRSNVWIVLDGVRHSLTQWAEITGLSRGAIKYRLEAGWSVRDALTKKSRIARDRIKTEMAVDKNE